jgi:methyl-accepting chemotaxis protein
MVADLENTLNRIAEKSRFLTERYRTVVAQNQALNQTVDELNKIIDDQKKKIEQLDMQVQYLTISSALAPSREDVEKTRETISNLVREIDRCLVELND